MRRTLLVCTLLLAAAPAASQPVIRPGERVTGALTASDPTLQDGSHFDLWRFDAQPRHVYRVTLRSTRFDAFLAVGANAADACVDCRTDDDGAGGRDAEVRFAPPSGGVYEIRANSFGAGETGEYELMIRDEGEPADSIARPQASSVVQAGETVQGSLREYEDTYNYEGRAGETLVVTVRTEGFDAIVTLGQRLRSGCQLFAGVGEPGSESTTTVTLPSDGSYHIHVRRARIDVGGSYTLTVARQ